MYADDSSLFFTGENINLLTLAVNAELEKIY